MLPLGSEGAVVLIGAGGLGLAAIAMLRAFDQSDIVSVDVSAAKRDAALAAGARATVDGSDIAGASAAIAALGPVAAVIDFVGSDATAGLGLSVLPKSGKLVLVGIGGGQLTLSVATTIFRANTIQGSLTGTIAELREVLGLAAAGKLARTPIQTVPKPEVNTVMTDLEAGRVTGRVVLMEQASVEYS